MYFLFFVAPVARAQLGAASERAFREESVADELGQVSRTVTVFVCQAKT